MRSWTKREQGLGVALALAAVGAIVVPAGASSGDDRAAVPIVDKLTDQERQKMDDLAGCMREHGVDPPPPPGELRPGEARPAPPRVDVLKRAAEECGLPEPTGVAIPFTLPAKKAAARRDEFSAGLRECAVPPPMVESERDR